MIQKSKLVENALEITSTGHKVRILAKGDRLYFSASDIVSTCGVKAPTKWIDRNIKPRPDINLTTLDFPVKTAKGYRKIGMLFVTAYGGKQIIKLTTCSDDAKKWLVEEVLGFRVDLPDSPEPEQERSNAITTPEADDNPRKSRDEINSKIDSILLELLDIKRALFARNQ